MDRESLRKSAANRRSDTSVKEERRATWHCKFCLRDYQTETGFMKHHCPEHERLEELKSPRGQTAYALYSEWMRLQRRSVPPAETFMVSKQYNYFLKFVDWADKTAIPNAMQFVKLMVQHDVQPLLWSRSTTYSLYLGWYDEVYPPEQQFIETLDELRAMAVDHGVPLSGIYENLGASEISRLVRRRKLSPWLLIVSPRFLEWARRLPQHDRDRLNEAIDFHAYAKKLGASPQMSKELKAACEQEGL